MWSGVSLCVILSACRVGQRITEEERQALVAKYKVILSHDSLNAFLERLPRDMLFVMRTSDLVRSLNKVRGAVPFFFFCFCGGGGGGCGVVWCVDVCGFSMTPVFLDRRDLHPALFL